MATVPSRFETGNSWAADEGNKSALHLPVMYLLGGVVLFASAAGNHVVLDMEKTDVGLDKVVITKLMFTCLGLLLGAFAFLGNFRVREVACSWPGVSMVLLFVLYVISSLLSRSSMAALASSASILSTYLLTITVAVQLGRDRLVRILFFASTVFVLGSWLVYFGKPEIGVLMEPLPEGGFARRMSGLSHPNTLGQYAGQNLLLGVILIVSYRKQNWIYPVICLMSAAALVACLSRTSIMALMIALVVGYRHFFVTRRL